MFGLLMCAMLLMQAVSLWHGVAHARGHLQALHTGDLTLTEPAGLERLFAPHDDSADCQALDKLSHADAPSFARPGTHVEHPALLRSRAPRLPIVAAPTSGFQARGPPARV